MKLTKADKWLTACNIIFSPLIALWATGQKAGLIIWSILLCIVGLIAGFVYLLRALARIPKYTDTED